jgi:hypothetical protein
VCRLPFIDQASMAADIVRLCGFKCWYSLCGISSVASMTTLQIAEFDWTRHQCHQCTSAMKYALLIGRAARHPLLRVQNRRGPPNSPIVLYTLPPTIYSTLLGSTSDVALVKMFTLRPIVEMLVWQVSL